MSSNRHLFHSYELCDTIKCSGCKQHILKSEKRAHDKQCKARVADQCKCEWCGRTVRRAYYSQHIQTKICLEISLANENARAAANGEDEPEREHFELLLQ